MDGPAPEPRAPRDAAALLAFAALLALPFLLLALFANPPAPVVEPEASETSVTVAPPELPATAKDTVILSELGSDDALARNELVAFAAIGPGKPLPFAFRGSAADRLRARDCLALAGMAEAGNDDAGQRAVMQVVLNRVRHPAFAKTVCGAVFEGSQRPTGCQFSFTCDGSLARRYPDAAWSSARTRADAMLDGATEPAVGNATHFHADYVYPWWSDQLDKVARVGPHLFFRWRGFWGSRTALSARYGGGEPDPLRLRETALAVAEANPLPTLLQSGTAVRSITAPPSSAAPAESAGAPPTSPGPGVHFVLLTPSDSPQALVERARALCPGTRYCQVYGWEDAANIPSQLPLSSDARRTLRFSFLPERAANPETIYFDCRLFPVTEGGRCLPK